MFINITASETGNNQGSSGALVNYLEKENHLQVEKGRGLPEENWFNGTGNHIRRQEVRMRIDRSVAKLSRNDAKFFLINISPSQKELAHLFAEYGEQGAKEKLKKFAVQVMDEYARNFKRPGINSHKDLLWFGKHENYRYYSHADKQVKDGTKQKGERKEGQQMHIQIIVSRKDITNRIKLSPQNTSKGKNVAHSEKLGQFNRTAFKQCGENLFDRFFDFDRRLKDSFNYVNTMKNGTTTQKKQMKMLESIPRGQTRNNNFIENISSDITKGLFQSVDQMMSTTVSAGIDLLSMLLEPVYIAQEMNPAEEAEKRRRRKKKKGTDQSQGLSR